MGTRKVVLNNEMIILRTIRKRRKKKNIREVWKKLWRGVEAALNGALPLFFARKIVRNVAPNHFEEVDFRVEAFRRANGLWR